MNYSEFTSSAYEELGIQSEIECFEHTLALTTDDRILVDGVETSFKTLKEAREHIKSSSDGPRQVDIREEVFRAIPQQMVVDLIRKYHPETKITNKLVESYLVAAADRVLSTDYTLRDLRSLYPADTVFENHTDYKLDDGSVVMISESTQKTLNKILGKHQNIIDHMRESKENFMDVINQIED